MADEADRAQAQVDAFTAQAIAAATRPYSGPAPDIIDGVACCAECGRPIPPARLAALPGVGLCVECAEELIQITGGW